MSDSSQQAIKQVVIVGGGTAGWIAANHLATQLKPKLPNGVNITLVESPNIPTVGVGEGTVPAMRKTLQLFGISETDFIRRCDATFKQSIKFIDWTYNPSHSNSNNEYHHLFDYPFIEQEDMTRYWLSNNKDLDRNYANTVSYQGILADAGLAPKTMTHREFSGEMSYAYHLDAGKFTEMLRENAIEKLGVNHIYADVDSVRLSENGDIEALLCKEREDIEGDFFVDCSGFSSFILGQQLNVPFVDKSDQLFVDNAVVMQVPYEKADSPIACFTLATAQDSGWIWDIGLSSRRGVGHVYASDFMDHDEAEQKLRDYVGRQADDLNCRRIPMRIGHREKFWVNNCVAIGLSQGFVEPLEATGLLVFDVTSKMLADNFPATRSSIPALAKRFNKTVLYAWERVIDFVKLHYFLSKRDDSKFWINNRKESTLSDSLLEKLSLWQSQPPTSYDFFTKHEIFNLDNYLYVLYGMDYPTVIDSQSYLFNDSDKAKQLLKAIDQKATGLSSQLLPHRELINRIKKHRLSKI